MTVRTMGQAEPSTELAQCPTSNVYTASCLGPENSALETKRDSPSDNIHAVPEANIVEQNSDEPTPKSLVFKLSFIGLAAAVFVFQLDATCLGIALPVSLIKRYFLFSSGLFSLSYIASFLHGIVLLQCQSSRFFLCGSKANRYTFN